MIHPTAIIYPNVIVEDDVYIGAYSVIGGQPEHKSFYDGSRETQGVVIRRGSRIFEHVTIHSGTINATEVGERSVVFNHSHIGHDCIIESDSVVGGNVSLAGHCHLMKGANVSGKSCLSQWVVIGAYGFVGGFTYITKHLPCGERWLGFPARFLGHNIIGLDRAQLSYEECHFKFMTDFKKLIATRNI